MAHGKIVRNEEILAIKKAIASGIDVQSIVALTGRSKQTVYRIKNGDFDEPRFLGGGDTQKDIRDIGRLLHTIANQNEQIIGILDSIRKAWVE